jgi:hypothetical protein
MFIIPSLKNLNFEPNKMPTYVEINQRVSQLFNVNSPLCGESGAPASARVGRLQQARQTI